MTSTDITKWADKHMFTAEPSDGAAGPVAYVLGAPNDPLGQIAACAFMYTGRVIRDTADVTDDDRRRFLEQIQKTILGMPLEAVSFHFMLEGVHRGITHQMVRQRTAAYAQESTRFAVKEDLTTATALPPSLEGTLSLKEMQDADLRSRAAEGLWVPNPEDGDVTPEQQQEWLEAHRNEIVRGASQLQKQRFAWDDAIGVIGNTYTALINTGMPNEEARGLMPTNITTRLNYITNLRNFYVEMGKRLSDQAQFEWRKVAAAYAKALLEYGKSQTYWTTITRDEYDSWDQKHPNNPIRERRFKTLSREEYEAAVDDADATEIGKQLITVRLSSAWQYEAIVHAIKPVEFQTGKPAFGADFDRPSRIGERVAEFARRGVPSSEWFDGSPEHGIPPIHPAEYLFDPNSARLDAGTEFDVFGNRVPVGRGWHFDQQVRNGGGKLITRHLADGTVQHKTWPTEFPEGAAIYE